MFYIPQAFGFLLPRLVPLTKPHTYMFATFVSNGSDATGRTPGAVMSRYVDVLPIQDVRFNRNNYDAITVVDKIGLEGTPTNTYFTVKGEFIGSISTTNDGEKDTTWMVLPTDAQTLTTMWPGADLTPVQSHTEAVPPPIPAPEQ